LVNWKKEIIRLIGFRSRDLLGMLFIERRIGKDLKEKGRVLFELLSQHFSDVYWNKLHLTLVRSSLLSTKWNVTLKTRRFAIHLYQFSL
jgi:hypothetical protein